MAKIDIKQLERELARIRKTRKKKLSLKLKIPKIPLPSSDVVKKIIIGIIAIVGVVALVIIVGVMFDVLKTPEPVQGVCQTKSCFIKKANLCEPVIYNTKIKTVELRLRTTGNCELIKEVTNVDKDEPENIKSLFKGAKMTCPYTKGQFEDKYIEQISYDMLTCKGRLADAIKTIL